MSMLNFYMLVGLPGSGREELFNELVDENTTLITATDVKNELPKGSNKNKNRINKIMREKTIEALNKGKDVVYDDINFNSEKRMKLLNSLKDINCRKSCIIMAKNIYDCIGKAPYPIIRNTQKEFEIPMYHEGWDSIRIISPSIEYNRINTIEELSNINQYNHYVSILSSNENFSGNIDMAQDNYCHSFSNSRHMYYTYKNLNTDNKYLKVAALLHDVGKCHCKEFINNDRYASYIAHENIGTYNTMTFLCQDPHITDKEIVTICTYIQLHSELLHHKLNKDELIKLVGQELYNDLYELFISDRDSER